MHGEKSGKKTGKMSSIVVKGAEKINSLVWFRNDLRIYDHSGLTHAVKNSNSVIGVYFFNPDHYKINELGFPKTDSFRAQFLIDSVKNLKKKIEQIKYFTHNKDLQSKG